MSFLTSGVGSLIGGVASGIGSLVGSSEASSASKQAAANQLQMYYQTRSDLSPYTSAGTSVLPSLTSLATSGSTGGGPDYISQAAANQPGTLTEAQLQQVPGYQFILNQGLKQVAAQNAARGLGVSGAQLKGAASYVTGLADQTYQNAFNQQQTQFQNYLNLNTAQQTNLQNQYSRLSGVASLGESAGAQTGAQGTQAAANYGNYLNQSGLATAAGTTGVGTALTSGINNYLGYNLLSQYLNQNTGGTGGYTNAAGTTGTLNYTPSNLFSGGPVLSNQTYVS